LTSARVRREPILSTDPDFTRLLVSFNKQRAKDPGERIREQIAQFDPEDAHAALVTERAKRSRLNVEAVELREYRKRDGISKAKRPFLDAIRPVLADLREYRPVSDRRVHYALLNDPPLIHSGKPDSRYRNDKSSYKAVCDLLTRARLAGLVRHDAVADETRPFTDWRVFPSVALLPRRTERVPYRRREDGGRGHDPPYRGELLRPNDHRPRILVIAAAEEHGRPVCKVRQGPADHPVLERLRPGGVRHRRVVHPVHARRLRHPLRNGHQGRADEGASGQVAAAAEHRAATTSSRYARFAAKYGRYAYELEAVPPAALRQWLDEAIRRLLDIKIFNQQVEAEKRDAVTLSGAAYRKTASEYLMQIDPDEDRD
jgi:hypothetical protein